jgi:hypothetical protein
MAFGQDGPTGWKTAKTVLEMKFATVANASCRTLSLSFSVRNIYRKR